MGHGRQNSMFFSYYYIVPWADLGGGYWGCNPPKPFQMQQRIACPTRAFTLIVRGKVGEVELKVSVVLIFLRALRVQILHNPTIHKFLDPPLRTLLVLAGECSTCLHQYSGNKKFKMKRVAKENDSVLTLSFASTSSRAQSRSSRKRSI